MTDVNQFKSIIFVFNLFGFIPFTIDRYGSELRFQRKYCTYFLKLICINSLVVYDYMDNVSYTKMNEDSKFKSVIWDLRLMITIISFNLVIVLNFLNLTNHYKLLVLLYRVDKKLGKFCSLADMKSGHRHFKIWFEVVFVLSYICMVYLIHIYFMVVRGTTFEAILRLNAVLWPLTVLFLNTLYLRLVAIIISSRYDKMIELLTVFKELDNGGTLQDDMLQRNMLQFSAEFFSDMRNIIHFYNRAFGSVILMISLNVFTYSAITYYDTISKILNNSIENYVLFVVLNIIFILPFPITICILSYTFQSLYEKVNRGIK